MKKAIFGILVVMVMWGCTQFPMRPLNYEERELVSIHEKVGETIDVEEREEFNLFPDIEDFRSAEFREIGGNALEITLETGEGTFISVIRDSLMVKMLEDYFGNFDVYEDSIALFERKWKILDHDTLGMPIAAHEVPQYAIAESHAVACGVGMCMLGAIPSCLWAFKVSDSSFNLEGGKSETKASFYPLFIAGEAVFILIGAHAGRQVDKIRVLHAIKQGRGLVEVEK